MSKPTHPVKDSAPTDQNLGITAIHHVGISTLDLDRLVAFYTDMFGCDQVAGLTWKPGSDDVDAALALDNSSARMVMLRLGEVYLELFEFDNPRPEPVDLDRPITNVGINHVCLLVDDLDVVVRRLADKNAVVHSSPRDIGDGPFVYCRDPDGNAIEFWQRPLTDAQEEQ
jgi:catechol 2,3-dioxygenase-like lactoylglutathione lyase family enzyme